MRILAYKLYNNFGINSLNIITFLKNHVMTWKFYFKASEYNFGVTLRLLT